MREIGIRLGTESGATTPVVYVIDDDAAVRDGLQELLAGAGFEPVVFASAERFLAVCDGARRGCVVLDVAMPGMSGPELQAALAARGIDLPIIFLTGHGTVAMSVRAMKVGALDFLEKPVAGDDLIAAVRNALTASAQRNGDQAERAAAQARYAELTAREREVMALAVAGLANKQVARQLGLSHRTVEIHRARAMRKMGAATLLELARAAQLCAQAPARRADPKESD